MSQAISNFVFSDDPETVDEQIMSIRDAQFMHDVLKLADKYLPNWVVGFLDKYSDDYPALSRQWSRVCSSEGVGERKQIMLTRFMSTDSNYRLLNSFVEVFVTAGFSVRRLQDIVPCRECNAGIPSLGLYSSMKSASLDVPEQWSETCVACKSSSA